MPTGKAGKGKGRRGGPTVPPGGWLSRLRFWGLVFFLLSMPLFFSPWNTEYGYAKTIYTLVTVSLLLILWAVESFPRREVKVEVSWLFPLLPALLLAALLSLSGGTPAGVVVQSATVILYFGFIFLLVVNAPSGIGRSSSSSGPSSWRGSGTPCLASSSTSGWPPGRRAIP